MNDMRLIVVDTETSGLGSDAVLLEVAAVDVFSGDTLYYVPAVPSHTFDDADPQALQKNRYFERGVWKDRLGEGDTAVRCQQLVDMLDGNVLAGSNPRFDSNVIRRHINNVLDKSTVWRKEPWFHRLTDLSAYAAGALGIHPARIPGLAEVCQRLQVDNAEAHSALGDAQAAAEAFRRVVQLKAAT